MIPQPLLYRTSLAGLILLSATAGALEPAYGQAQVSRLAIVRVEPEVGRLAPRALELTERGLGAVRREFFAGSDLSSLGSLRSPDRAAGLWVPDRAMISRQPLVGLQGWHGPTLEERSPGLQSVLHERVGEQLDLTEKADR